MGSYVRSINVRAVVLLWATSWKLATVPMSLQCAAELR